MSILGAVRYLVFGGQPPGVAQPSQRPLLPPPSLPASSPVDDYSDAQVPVYPDSGTPLPSVHPRRLLEKQEAILRDIHSYSSLSREAFQALMYPVLLRYAEMVHLLPASESHHHCGVGGLLRHGLEVCLNAIVAAKAIEFALDYPPSEREQVRPRWRVAAMVGGLCHDLGKPIIDIGAISADGSLAWNPHRETLWAWLERNRLRDYRLRWRTGARHKRHEWYNAVPLYRLIPEATLNWLCDDTVDQQHMDALVGALSGSTDTTNPLVDLLRLADSKSVERDLRDARQRMAANALGGQRNLAARIIRIIHDRLESGIWRCNRPGDMVWVTTEGVFAIFPAVLREAVAVLREQGETALPQDTGQVLQMLADMGAIQAHMTPTGTQHYTVMVRYHAQDRGHPMVFEAQSILFASNDIIPKSMILPDPVQAEILRKDRRTGQDEGNADAPGVGRPDGAPAPETPAQPAPPTAAQPAAAAEPEAGDAGAAGSPVRGDAGAAKPEEGAEAAGMEAAAQEPPVVRDRAREPEVRAELMREAYAAMQGEPVPDTPECAAAWLSEQETEGAWLLHIAERVAAGELREGQDILERDGHIHLAIMTCLSGLGLDIAMVREALEKRGWLAPDPRNPNRRTVDVDLPNGKRVASVRLRPDISQIFGLLLPTRTADAASRIETARRRKARPLGPYLDADAAAAIENLADPVSARDGAWVRPAFLALLTEVSAAQSMTPQELPPRDVRRAAKEFCRLHPAITEPWLLRHLHDGGNPLLVSGKDEVTGKLRAVVNPAYRLEVDIRARTA